MTPGHWETLAWLCAATFRTFEPWTVPHFERLPLLFSLGYAKRKSGEYRTSRYYPTEAGRRALASRHHVPMGDNRARHKELHKALDELVACYVTSNKGKGLNNTTLMDLMRWSHAATEDPKVCQSHSQSDAPTIEG